MRKILIVLLCALLCLSIICTSALAYEAVSQAARASEDSPNYFLNFTDKQIEYDLGVTNQVNINFFDGYTQFVATGNDSHVYLPAPSGNLSDNRYIVIVFRTSYAGGGELYAAKDDGVPMGESNSTHVSWSSWEGNGEWQTKIIDIYSMCQSGTQFINFRFDPFTGNRYGATIDIKCIAGFSSAQAAEAFNLDEYLTSSEASTSAWLKPEYKEMQLSPEDTYSGTLEYTENDDGTVTISYMYDGELKTYTVPNNPIYTSGGFAATDDVGRTLENSNTVGIYGDNGEHYVGLFYFLWMGEHGDPGVYDLTKIQHKYGQNSLNANYIDPSTGRKIYGDIGHFHWWGEPLYGYYYSSDEWVMRKHVELLTNIGVDFLYIDATNGYTYKHNAIQLMKILHEYNELGYNAPEIVFYTNTNATSTVQEIYNYIYRSNRYPDTWLYVDGKPCIITNSNDITDESLKSFFTIKEAQWPNEYMKSNAWPWMDFSWPQRVFEDNNNKPSAISVSVAQHCGSVAFSDSAYYFDPLTENNRGRSFREGQSFWEYRTAYDNDNSITKYGYNFQQQWNVAIEQDVPYVLVTSWNEWIAQRLDGKQHRGDADKVLFIDTASMEFSRDIEMMRGGYFDNYYMQLAFNIQRLKGAAPIIIQDARIPINITDSFNQWEKVAVEYTDPQNDIVNRNNRGFGGSYYRDSSGRNDIVSAKVTNDTKNAYFYVKTAIDIKKYDGNSSWMQLYLNTDQNADTGWYGYDYIVNYAAEQDLVTSVAKYDGDSNSYSFKVIGNVNYTVSGNEMMISVPLEMLGINNYNEICIEFKWFDADSGVYVNEMEDFYTYGDAAPLGRLNYVYQNCLAEDVTNNPIVNENNNDDETVGDQIFGSNEPVSARGCRSGISYMIVLPVVISGCFVFKRKKR